MNKAMTSKEEKRLSHGLSIGYPEGRRYVRSLFTLLLAWFVLSSAPAVSQDPAYPLAPPDTSSPRATLHTFLDTMNASVQALSSGKRLEARALLERAGRCLDLSEEPEAIRRALMNGAALRMKEVLDRIALPPFSDIPGAKAVRDENLKSWTIPHTEITIALSKSNPHLKRFLFTPETVRRSVEFYERVRNLPYRSDSGHGSFYAQMGSKKVFGFVGKIVHRMPQWLLHQYNGLRLWQWIALVLSILVGAVVVALAHTWGSTLLTAVDRRWNTVAFGKITGLILPVSLLLITGYYLEFFQFDLHLVGPILKMSLVALYVLEYLSILWILGYGLNFLASLVIHVSRFEASSPESQLTRLAFRIITGAFVFFTAIHLGARLGLPTYSLVTGLGVGGVAVALASREALGNIFGSIMIMIDRPFKVGDYIVLADKERGVVKEIGLRSTRILTRDDILISIPNAEIANSKIVNESGPVPRHRIRIRIGVAYASNMKMVEETLIEIAEREPLVIQDPAPRVRVRSFGSSAVELELLCWIDQPEDKGRTAHHLSLVIHEEFAKKGISIPFPQREITILGQAEGSGTPSKD